VTLQQCTYHCFAFEVNTQDKECCVKVALTLLGRLLYYVHFTEGAVSAVCHTSTFSVATGLTAIYVTVFLSRVTHSYVTFPFVNLQMLYQYVVIF
jgi:hypothetical protein